MDNPGPERIGVQYSTNSTCTVWYVVPCGDSGSAGSVFWHHVTMIRGLASPEARPPWLIHLSPSPSHSHAPHTHETCRVGEICFCPCARARPLPRHHVDAVPCRAICSSTTSTVMGSIRRRRHTNTYSYSHIYHTLRPAIYPTYLTCHHTYLTLLDPTLITSSITYSNTPVL
jgi:hypothetical protein